MAQVLTTPAPAPPTPAAQAANPANPRPSNPIGTPTFLSGTTLTFTLANSGGIAVLTVIGLLGYTITAVTVVVVAAVLGGLVVLLGTEWARKSEWKFDLQQIGSQVVIGLMNVFLLAVALWGSVEAIRKALPQVTGGG